MSKPPEKSGPPNPGPRQAGAPQSGAQQAGPPQSGAQQAGAKAAPPRWADTRRPPTVPYAGGSPSVKAEQIDAPPEPPLPPRAITPTVRRRSWTEPRVRSWWIASLVLLVVGIWFVTDQIAASRSEADLIHNGVVVPAIISGVDNDSRVGKKSPPGSTVTLKFDWKGADGQPASEYVSGTLYSQNDTDFIVTGSTVPLRVDPRDPTRWTNRTEPEPIARRLIAGGVIFPVVLGTALWALFSRRRILRTWREGEAQAYSVVDTHHTALAPLSHAVRAVSATGHDRRVISVFISGKHPRPKPGDVLWLIHPRNKPAASIAAMAYE